MSAPNLCTCTLEIKDFAGATFDSAELIAEPRKSFINTPSSNIILSAPQRVTADANGVCTMDLVRGNNQLISFTLHYNTGQQYGSIIFDPIVIPDQATLNLSTVLSVSRG